MSTVSHGRTVFYWLGFTVNPANAQHLPRGLKRPSHTQNTGPGDSDAETGLLTRCTFTPKEMFFNLTRELVSNDFRNTTDGKGHELKWKIKYLLDRFEMELRDTNENVAEPDYVKEGSSYEPRACFQTY